MTPEVQSKKFRSLREFASATRDASRKEETDEKQEGGITGATSSSSATIAEQLSQKISIAFAFNQSLQHAKERDLLQAHGITDDGMNSIRCETIQIFENMA